MNFQEIAKLGLVENGGGICKTRNFVLSRNTRKTSMASGDTSPYCSADYIWSVGDYYSPLSTAC